MREKSLRSCFSIQRSSTVVVGVLIALAVAMLATPLDADDTQLFQAANARPNVMFLVDISSSMHRDLPGVDTPMSADDPSSKFYQAKKAVYDVIKEIGDTINYGWATFDMRNMRLRRKTWLYKVRSDPSWVPGVPLLGSDTLVLFGEPLSSKNALLGNGFFEPFWNNFDDVNKIDTYGSCTGLTDDPDQVYDYPKLRHDGTYETRIWYDDGTDKYRFTFHKLDAGTSSEMGEIPFTVKVTVQRRTSSNCFDIEAFDTIANQEIVTFVPAITEDLDGDPLPPYTEYISWLRSGNGSLSMKGYQAGSACTFGLDLNDDDDLFKSYRAQHSYDFEPDPFGRYDADPSGDTSPLARGDFIPWDWLDGINPDGTKRISNRQEILWRLAPNIAYGETQPDFRVARYFENVPVVLDSLEILPLKTVPGVSKLYPPIAPSEKTPIEQSILQLLAWYEKWEPEASDPDTGDLALPCRQRYVILLSDGEDTCAVDRDFDPAWAARTLFEETSTDTPKTNGIRTFVIAFGIEPPEGQSEGLDCNNADHFNNEMDVFQRIACEGRTYTDKDGDGEEEGPGPIYVTNRDGLVEALLDFLDIIQSEATSISAAAVPAVQANVADKIFLTEFTPLDNLGIWPGTLEAFVKPLPFDADGLPDSSVKCTSTRTSGCLAWEAQEVVVTNQMLDPTDPLGDGLGQRRVYYSELATDDALPRQRHFFGKRDPVADYSNPPAELLDLWKGFNLPVANATEAQAAETKANLILDEILRVKTANLPNGDQRDFVIGDFFHSDPRLMGSPSNTTYFIQDAGGNPEAGCESDLLDADDNVVVSVDEERRRSYRCYALQQRFRRKVLIIGSNEGQVHAFDAGKYRKPEDLEPAETGEPTAGEFDNGTGREIFAYAPRPVLPTVKDLTIVDTIEHRFTVDGGPTTADVFIDPLHDGPLDATNPPTNSERLWRTVVVGGLRRGGGTPGGGLLDPYDVNDADDQQASGYYALDVTQPDPLETFDLDGDGDTDTWIPDFPGNTTPTCLAGPDDRELTGTLATQCGPIPYASTLWEFNDTMVAGTTTSSVTGDPRTVAPIRLDEDDNGYVDLAFTWSRPVLGRIRVCTSSAAGAKCDPESSLAAEKADLEDRFVAVFGGGVDPDEEYIHERGNFLYMVDLETGQAIYKQPLLGAAPAKAAIQPSRDGYLERIYIPTTLGFLYRVDLLPRLSSNNKIRVPRLKTVTLTETIVDDEDPTGPALTVEKEVLRILPESDGGTGRLFKPIIIFNANDATVADILAEPALSQAGFLEPSLFFIADLGQYGVAFGTGDRENLFSRMIDAPPGRAPARMIVFVDDIGEEDLRQVDVSDEQTFTPLQVAEYKDLTGSSPLAFSGDNFLLDPDAGDRGGWYLDLLGSPSPDPFVTPFTEDERLVGAPLVISGLLFFSTFEPKTVSATGDALCEQAGLSRVYSMLVTSGEGILIDGTDRVRSIERPNLVTSPFAEQSATKEADTGSPGDDLTPELEEIMNALKELFPENCSFPPGYRVDIKVRNQDTGMTFVAPVPMCVIETSFREF